MSSSLGLQVFEDVNFALQADLGVHRGGQEELLGGRGNPEFSPHLSWGELERVPLGQEDLEVPEPPETARNRHHSVTGKIQADQG